MQFSTIHFNVEMHYHAQPMCKSGAALARKKPCFMILYNPYGLDLNKFKPLIFVQVPGCRREDLFTLYYNLNWCLPPIFSGETNIIIVVFLSGHYNNQ